MKKFSGVHALYYFTQVLSRINYKCRLRYGRMVKALACRVEGPGLISPREKVSEKSFGYYQKKKKKASYPLLA